MILFLDTSALVKLYITETDSVAIHAAVQQADAIAVTRIAWAEACAAMARRARENPQDESALLAAKKALAKDWIHYVVVEVSQPVVERAGEYAETFALRAYDSIQLATASEILIDAPGQVAFACFDHRLNKAAKLLGMQLILPHST